MNASQRHASTRAVIVLIAFIAALALPAASSASESAADQYRPGVSGAGGTRSPNGPANPAGARDADAAAAATAPDFNATRNDTDGGGRGGLVFLAALGAGLLLTAGLLAWRRHDRAGPSLASTATATHSPRQG